MEAAPQYWQSPEALKTIYVMLADRRAGAARRRSRATSRPTRRSRSTTRASSPPPRSRSTCRRACRCRGRGARSTQRCARIGVPTTIHGSFQGTARAFQQSLDEPAVADPRRAARGLHRARHPLRELRAPDHDPLDAALGGRRRAARAAAVQHRVQHHRADRRHPADRHRQEERDHDDRLRARRRARAAASTRATRSSRPACCASARS